VSNVQSDCVLCSYCGRCCCRVCCGTATWRDERTLAVTSIYAPLSHCVLCSDCGRCCCSVCCGTATWRDEGTLTVTWISAPLSHCVPCWKGRSGVHADAIRRQTGTSSENVCGMKVRVNVIKVSSRSLSWQAVMADATVCVVVMVDETLVLKMRTMVAALMTTSKDSCGSVDRHACLWWLK
jgi:hypothetical protein